MIHFHKFEADEAVSGYLAVDMVLKRLLNKCCNKMYKLIFMDIQMPDMDGYQTTTKIIKLLKQHGHNGCTILALTSNSTDDTEEKALQVGMKEVYRKPMTEEKLRDLLNKYYYN